MQLHTHTQEGWTEVWQKNMKTTTTEVCLSSGIGYRHIQGILGSAVFEAPTPLQKYRRTDWTAPLDRVVSSAWHSKKSRERFIADL